MPSRAFPGSWPPLRGGLAGAAGRLAGGGTGDRPALPEQEPLCLAKAAAAAAAGEASDPRREGGREGRMGAEGGGRGGRDLGPCRQVPPVLVPALSRS